MLDVAECRYWYSDQALSRAGDVYRRLTSPLKSTMISALPCPENTSVVDALGVRLSAYRRSIEYFPAPVTHNSSRPPMMLMFL